MAMRPRNRECRPPAGSGTQDAANVSTIVTGADHIVVDMAAWRQRRSWAQAVLWLHDHGLPAAAPEGIAAWLRRHGAGADWYYRNPCHDGGCYVLTAEGDDPPPEIHVTCFAGMAPTGTGPA